MKERIKKYMDYKSISAGELATLLDVQRSNISHVLNGRNMPGAAFIEKFLLSFPDLDARWLLTGVGEMISNVNASEIFETIPQTKVEHGLQNLKVSDNESNKSIEKPINKVVLLFSDGTFIDYNKK